MLETPEVVINPGSIQAEVECNKDLEITLQKREFSIVGDNVYVTTSSEAPQWLLDLINGTIANAIAEGTTDFDDLRENILNAIAAMNIAKNDYDSYVIKLEDAEGRLLAYTETLNATVADSVAQIVSTLVTKVTADEALTIAVDAIQSSINGGAIKAQIDTINTTLATESLSRATQVDTIMAAITDESSGLAANATAIEILDATVTANQTANATWQTNLETFLETGDTTGTTIDSQSNIYSTLRSDITSAESKFGYDSTIIVNGNAYDSGFGIVSTGIPVGSYTDPNTGDQYIKFDSEFWIKADQFRVSSASNVGYTPFTIDGNNLVLNGTVKFVNTTGGTGSLQEVVQSYVETVAVGDKNINITDNLIPVESMLGDINNSGYQFISTPSKTSTAGIDTFAEVQVALDGVDEVYSPYVDELQYAYYYRFGIKDVTSLDRFKIVSINGSNVATLSNITYNLDSGQFLSSSSWYIIDGIINPIGGNTSASGSVRTATGVKIGTINNFPMPTGTTKVLLGWIANCTVSRMKLAKITADTLTGNYVTQDYVDTTLTSNMVALTSTEEARDGLIDTYYQTTAPTSGMSYGDYWLDTDHATYQVSRYQGTGGYNTGTLSWTVIDNTTARAIQSAYKANMLANTAQSTANTAQTTANSKITTFYQPNVPTSSTAGDIWIDTDDGNKMYIANAANVNSIVTSGNGWYNKTLVVPPTDFTSNNDLFAQAQGFANFAEMETSYSLLGSTIINGGYINTDLIEAESITADKIDAYAISGKTISGGTITGTRLYGTYIEGAIIKASYIDLSSTATLTSWQQYTPANYPSAYDANFAKNNDGTLLVDSQGYVRLMGNTTILTQNFYYSLGYNGSTVPSINRTDAFVVNLYSWSSYTVATVNRMITNSHRLLLSSPSGNWSSYNAGMSYSDMLYSATNTIVHTQIATGTAYVKFNILGDVYECYTYNYTSSAYSFNWYIKKNSVTLYSGNTPLSYGIHLASKYGMNYGIFVGDDGYHGVYPMIKVKIASIDTTLTGLGYNEPVFNLIQSTAVGKSYVYRIDIPFMEVV